MRYISLALLLMLVVLATIPNYGTNASSCEHSGKSLSHLTGLGVDESCSRSSRPETIGETVEVSQEKVDDSDDAEEYNVPQVSFFSKLKKAFSFLYNIIMWFVNLTRE
ncbi:uncharacterized protein [Drosophila pseudoobscura]|uniref:Uncharacterized protein n=1 Tax=Drosophila pseudoobscura pseudoobscura TaxID=46245 RepID=A0A6I8WEH8_DROPS|nr:uncharacterized protein LOC26532923 [Drosophila pseudoobscura]